MAKAARIKENDTLVLRVKVLKIWPDEKVTIDVNGKRVTVREDNRIITAAECRDQAEACLALQEEPDIAVQRARILLTMVRTWKALASLKERLDTS